MKYLLSLLLTSLILCAPIKADLLRDNSTFHKVNVAPGIDLRVSHTRSKSHSATGPKTVVIFLPGRASFFEKNKGLILGVTGHSYEGTQGVELEGQADFWTLDMRAHGASGGRISKGNQRGHIDSFETYLSDIHTVITKIIAPFYEGEEVEFILMGSSLGGHLALRYLQDYASETALSFKRALLIVPMIEFNTAPWPRSVAKALVQTGCFLGASQMYAIGHGDLDLSKSDFSRFKGHHNETAFDNTNEMMGQNPSLITGGPTFGWVKAAFESEEPLLKRALPKDVEVIAYVAGADTAVDSKATLKFCKERNITVRFYPKSRHNILKETKESAPTFWTDLKLKAKN